VAELIKWISFDLGGEPKIFFDYTELNMGDSWAPNVESSLIRSKLLMPIITAEYFKSKHTLREWETFRLREKMTGSNSLTIPILLRGRPFIPKEFMVYQLFDMSDERLYSGAKKNTYDSIKTSKRIEELSYIVVERLQVVPLFDSSWKMAKMLT